MDPDVAWREILDIAKRQQNLRSGILNLREADDALADMDRLSELVVALDEWVHNGGFAPAVFTIPY